MENHDAYPRSQERGETEVAKLLVKLMRRRQETGRAEDLVEVDMTELVKIFVTGAIAAVFGLLIFALQRFVLDPLGEEAKASDELVLRFCIMPRNMQIPY
jgi:hypothetical protein